MYFWARHDCSLSPPQVTLPDWVDFAKTGAFKELAPLDPDWYYIRAGKCWGCFAVLHSGIVLAGRTGRMSCSSESCASTSLLTGRCHFPAAAAIARRIYMRQGLGVGMFRKIYGGRSNKKGSVTPGKCTLGSAVVRGCGGAAGGWTAGQRAATKQHSGPTV